MVLEALEQCHLVVEQLLRLEVTEDNNQPPIMSSLHPKTNPSQSSQKATLNVTFNSILIQIILEMFLIK